MSKPLMNAPRQLPANFGPLKGANANARVTGPCGDTMEFWLRIDSDQFIQARFITDGCAASIASGTMTASMVEGKELTAADSDHAGSSAPSPRRTAARPSALSGAGGEYAQGGHRRLPGTPKAGWADGRWPRWSISLGQAQSSLARWRRKPRLVLRRGGGFSPADGANYP